MARCQWDYLLEVYLQRDCTSWKMQLQAFIRQFVDDLNQRGCVNCTQPLLSLSMTVMDISHPSWPLSHRIQMGLLSSQFCVPNRHWRVFRIGLRSASAFQSKAYSSLFSFQVICKENLSLPLLCLKTINKIACIIALQAKLCKHSQEHEICIGADKSRAFVGSASLRILSFLLVRRQSSPQ